MIDLGLTPEKPLTQQGTMDQAVAQYMDSREYANQLFGAYGKPLNVDAMSPAVISGYVDNLKVGLCGFK